MENNNGAKLQVLTTSNKTYKWLTPKNFHQKIFQGAKNNTPSPVLLFKKNLMSKKIQVLQEMGFDSHITYKVKSGTNSKQNQKKKFNIGISDFWTEKDREKFLRERGYQEAFNSMKKKALIKDLAHGSSVRRYNLPYVTNMDSQKRTSIFQQTTEGAQVKPKANKNNSHLHKISTSIDLVIDKCERLTQEIVSNVKKRSVIVSDFSEGMKEKPKTTKNICFSSPKEENFNQGFDSLNDRSCSLKVFESDGIKKSAVVRRATDGYKEKAIITNRFCFSSPETGKMHDGIDLVINRCEDLVSDNSKFKAIGNQIVKDLRNCVEPFRVKRRSSFMNKKVESFNDS
jgi:hypothetical protein